MVLPLFQMAIGNMGAGDMNYGELSQKIELQTGGIGTEIHSLTPLVFDKKDNNDDIKDVADYNQDRMKYILEVNSYCLNRNIDNMLNIMEDCLLHPNYEFYERLESLIKDKVQSDITHLIESGHSYAISHAASAFGRYLPNENK